MGALWSVLLGSVFAAAMGAPGAFAQIAQTNSETAETAKIETNQPGEGGAFALGQIGVTLPAIIVESDGPAAAGFGYGQGFGTGLAADVDSETSVALSDDVATAAEMFKFDRQTLDEAVKLIPGTATASSGSSRNERQIYVRGFDRLQVPLSIDGIRVYMPADNRLDFGRFLTPDLAEVQVSKGYPSVIDGPGALGGAINLVTRKPVKDFEAHIQGGIDTSGHDLVDGWNGYAGAGSRQENFYFYGGAAFKDRNRWRLSDDFDPAPWEDGGYRERSDAQDWRGNAKFGYTPNATDEYSLSFIKQSGEKRSPPHVERNGNFWWDWPEWDVQNIYFLSTTEIGDASYLKTRLFHNTFNNTLAGDETRGMNRSVYESMYDDWAAGGSAEFGTELIPRNFLRAAFHYRHDNHKEWREDFLPAPDIEPEQESIEDTYSIAVENTFHATDRLDWIAGLSHDWRDLIQAQDYNFRGGGTLYDFETADDTAFNWQTMLRYRYSDTGEVRASVSDRTRFPTLTERFSNFGPVESNPDLGPEQARNYEIGWSDFLFGNTRASGAIFYSDVTAIIQTVFLPNPPNPPNSRRSENVGDGRYYGFEFGLQSNLSDDLIAGELHIHRT